MILRPYQKEASDKIIEHWQCRNRVLAVLPTGAGKTIVFADVLRRREGFGRALVLAHRKELIQQAADKISAVTGIRPEIEMGKNRASGGDVVCASVQTIAARGAGGEFSTIIVDEAHHVVSEQFQRVVSAVAAPDAKILGVTATPDRGDKRELGGFFESLAFEVNLMQMVRDGYLSPISVIPCPIAIDFSGLVKSCGDFTLNSIADAIEPRLMLVANEMARVALGRKTIAFLPLVRTSIAFSELLRSRGFNALHVDGGMRDAERIEILEKFKNSGPGTVLCNSMLLTEGFDEPSIDCVAVLRPTSSRPLYSQMIGRGTRLFPGKTNLLIPDFLWMTGKHALVRPCHLVAKTEEDAKEMSKIVEGQDGEIELGEVEAQSDEIKKQREEALRKALDKASANKHMAARKNLDPIAFCLDVGAVDAANYKTSPYAPDWAAQPPTPKQLSAIQKFKISTENIKTKGHASKILDVLMSRVKMNLATPKQVEWLKRLGHPDPFKATRSEAQSFISNSI